MGDGHYATNAPYIDQNLAGQIYLGSSGIFYGNKFVVNSNGSLYCTDAHIVGDIYARNGYFAGTVYASEGKFSGELDATSGKFDNLTGTRFTFQSGKIASGVEIYGSLMYNNAPCTWGTIFVPTSLTMKSRTDVCCGLQVSDGKVTGYSTKALIKKITLNGNYVYVMTTYGTPGSYDAGYDDD